MHYRRHRREESGKPAVIVDRSLLLVDGGPEWEAADTAKPPEERGRKLPFIDPERFASVTYPAAENRSHPII